MPDETSPHRHRPYRRYRRAVQCYRVLLQTGNTRAGGGFLICVDRGRTVTGVTGCRDAHPYMKEAFRARPARQGAGPLCLAQDEKPRACEATNMSVVCIPATGNSGNTGNARAEERS